MFYSVYICIDQGRSHTQSSVKQSSTTLVFLSLHVKVWVVSLRGALIAFKRRELSRMQRQLCIWRKLQVCFHGPHLTSASLVEVHKL